MGKTNWADYHKLTKDNPPSELLVSALVHVKDGSMAIAIGDGALKDTKFLLQGGFDVTVVDREIQPSEIASTEKLHCFISPFNEFKFQDNTFDLAAAMFALPFNAPESFDAVFSSIKKSLKKEGIFCGQFFGKRDEWSGDSDMTFHTKEQVEFLLADMEILHFIEVEKDSKTANGNPKHWHVFHVIARK